MTLTLTGYYGYNNYGDDLMLYALLQELLEKTPFNINVLVKNNIPDFLKDNDRIKVFIFKSNSKIYNLKIFFKAILKSDMLIWGGGTCFTNQDGVSIRYFLFTKILNKKIGYLGIGVGKDLEGIKKKKTKFILNLSDVVTARDKYSFDTIKLLLKKSRQSKLYQTADLSYLINFNKTLSKSGYLLISLHNLKKYLSLNEIENRRKYLIDFFNKKNKYKIKILPLCDEDYEENKKFYDALKIKLSDRVEFILTNNFIDRSKIIASANFYYSERLHGFISAYFHNTYCIPLKYSYKFDAFIESEEIVDLPMINIDNLEDILKMKLEKPKGLILNKNIKKQDAKKNISILLNYLKN